MLYVGFLTGCQTTKPEPMNLKWQFCEVVPQRPLACLELEGIQRLRGELKKCEDERLGRR